MRRLIFVRIYGRDCIYIGILNTFYAKFNSYFERKLVIFWNSNFNFFYYFNFLLDLLKKWLIIVFFSIIFYYFGQNLLYLRVEQRDWFCYLRRCKHTEHASWYQRGSFEKKTLNEVAWYLLQPWARVRMKILNTKWSCSYRYVWLPSQKKSSILRFSDLNEFFWRCRT